MVATVRVDQPSAVQKDTQSGPFRFHRGDQAGDARTRKQFLIGWRFSVANFLRDRDGDFVGIRGDDSDPVL